VTKLLTLFGPAARPGLGQDPGELWLGVALAEFSFACEKAGAAVAVDPGGVAPAAAAAATGHGTGAGSCFHSRPPAAWCDVSVEGGGERERAYVSVIHHGRDARDFTLRGVIFTFPLLGRGKGSPSTFRVGGLR